MKKELTLSTLLAAAVMSAAPAMAANDIKAGHIAKIEAVADLNGVNLARAQQQQQQQQQQQNRLAAATQTGVLLGASSDNGFDA
ncbi:hypothetical protein ACUHMQ_16330 [Chitinimonas sp. PSY-7]|uniref:hypothetical protein n=1 Tax=Chitinimonas sp. PSY-7 TaxID=3459088 RepID=UPI00403FCCBE